MNAKSAEGATPSAAEITQCRFLLEVAEIDDDSSVADSGFNSRIPREVADSYASPARAIISATANLRSAGIDKVTTGENLPDHTREPISGHRCRCVSGRKRTSCCTR